MRVTFASVLLAVLVNACGKPEPIRAEPRLTHKAPEHSKADEPKPAIAVHVEPPTMPAPPPPPPPPAKAKVSAKVASKAASIGGGESSCRPGARRPCFTQAEWERAPQVPMARMSGDDDAPRRRPRGPIPMMVCMELEGGGGMWERDSCGTPLVVAFDDAPVEFTRASADFALQGTPRTEWVSAATPWLALDRDGSGCIESEHELFAGFKKLALLDANGDGVLDRRDPAFGELVLWADHNQDKQCTPDEISKLTLDMIPLQAVTMPWTGRSVEGEIATLPGRRGRVSDVFLAPF